MLISFKVSNYLSIEKELIFSAIATEDETLLENTIDVPKYGIRLLKTMALFGANAAGKTNILKALSIIENLLHLNRNRWNISTLNEDFSPNKNKQLNEVLPIRCEYNLLIENVFYTYTFAYTSERIEKEKLVKHNTDGTEHLIYSRVWGSNQKYEWLPKSFFKEESANFFYKLTAESSLFLEVATNRVNNEAVPKISILENVFEEFFYHFSFHIREKGAGSLSDYNYLVTFIQQKPENKTLILKLIELVGIPIKTIEFVEPLYYPTDKNEIEKWYMYTNYDKPTERKSIKILTTHSLIKEKKTPIYFDFFTEESNGTRQFLAWLGYWLYELQKGEGAKVFVVDELGTHLHPLLTRFLLKIFYSKKLNPYNSQLIFTTHEVKLMDKTLMRADQLYLINQKENTTVVESIADYEDTDKYTRFDNAYLHGTFSGIPKITHLNLDDVL